MDDEFLSDKIAEFQKQERSSFAVVKHVERIALLLMVTGMALLIALAWENF